MNLQIDDLIFKKEKIFIYTKGIKKEILLVNSKNYKKKSEKLKIFDSSKESSRDYLKFIDMVHGAEFLEDKNRSHQVGSGLDDATVKLMKKNKIIYGFNITQLIQEINKGNLDLISRINQNIKLLKKYDVKVLFFSGLSNISKEKRSFTHFYFRHI